ncbi:MAG: hypothetical protein Q9163_004245 [Psora crenata]
MRYFEDGDLTEGLKVTNKPYPIDLIEGEWHIVWVCMDGRTRTTDYDDPAALSLMGFHLRQIEPGRKRKKSVSGHLRAELKFCKWGLEYEGIYNTEGQATVFTLKANNTPRRVNADDEAYLLFGVVTDDHGAPFLQFSTSASAAKSSLEHLQNLEFIAKKTDPTGINCLELTKNERLRLGYPLRSDGSFEDGLAHNIKRETFESLTKQLQEHTEAQARIIEKLGTKRAEVDKQLHEAALASHRVITLNPQSGTKCTSTMQPATLKEQHRPSATAMVDSVLSQTACPAATTPPTAEDSSRTSISPFGTPSSDDLAESAKYRKKVCRACNTSVSSQNWAVHEKTNKHKFNISGEGTPARAIKRIKTSGAEKEGRLARPSVRKVGDMSLRVAMEPDTPSSM